MEIQNQEVLFRDMIQALSSQRKYVKMFYFNDLHELLSLTALVTGISIENDQEVLITAGGEHIPIGQLANIAGVQNPAFADYETCLTCRCDC
jgi:hypothetical protein